MSSDQSVAEIELSRAKTAKKGKGSWKINVKLLVDTAFQWDVVAFHHFFKAKKNDYPTICDRWDVAKYQYKELAITHLVQLSKTREHKQSPGLTNTSGTYWKKTSANSTMHATALEGLTPSQQMSILRLL